MISDSFLISKNNILTPAGKVNHVSYQAKIMFMVETGGVYIIVY